MLLKHVAAILGSILMPTLLVSAQETTPAVAAGAKQTVAAAPAKRSGALPQKSVKKTIEQAIKSLEAYDCITVAVDLLSPIKRAQIRDLEAYKAQRQCSPQDKGNIEDALLAMRLARGGIPEYNGITATISLEGAGLKIPKITLIKYVDGRWYFNEI